MNVPTLVQLRSQLGQALVAEPNSPILHSANRLLNAVFARKDELPSQIKLGAARATALALDLAHGKSLSAGQALPLLSDYLDPDRQPELAWARTNVGDLVDVRTGRSVAPTLEAQLKLAQQSLRDAPGQAALDVANALDAAYQAVAESARNVGRGAASAIDSAARSAVLPVALGAGLLLAWGYANRRRPG